MKPSIDFPRWSILGAVGVTTLALVLGATIGDAETPASRGNAATMEPVGLSAAPNQLSSEHPPPDAVAQLAATPSDGQTGTGIDLETALANLARAERLAAAQGRALPHGATALATQLQYLIGTYVVQSVPAVQLADITARLNDLAILIDPQSDPAAVEDQALEAPLAALLTEFATGGGSLALDLSGLSLINGELPEQILCPVRFAPEQHLRCDAAVSLGRLGAAYHLRFGASLPVADAYRTFANQIAVFINLTERAAEPGRSQHGWGLAIDLGDPVAGGSSTEYQWLREVAPLYGWDNPEWARPGGTKPEPWHFEFVAAAPMPERARTAAQEAAYAEASSIVAARVATERAEREAREAAGQNPVPDATTDHGSRPSGGAPAGGGTQTGGGNPGTAPAPAPAPVARAQQSVTLVCTGEATVTFTAQGGGQVEISALGQTASGASSAAITVVGTGTITATASADQQVGIGYSGEVSGGDCTRG